MNNTELFAKLKPEPRKVFSSSCKAGLRKICEVTHIRPKCDSMTSAETSIMITEDGRPKARIILSQTTPVTQFAVEELQSYVKKISGADLPVGAQSAAADIAIMLKIEPVDETLGILSAARDRFRIECRNSQVTIIGCSDRAVLYGVYAFLERLGCRWYYPVPEEEVIPHTATIRLQEMSFSESPALAVRGLYFVPVIGADYKLVRNYIDWMAKRRLNMFLTHPESYGSEDGDFIRWAQVSDRILPEIKKRGIILNMDIHSALYYFPPTKYFAAHPDWFALVGGKRQPEQICYSNKQAIDVYATSIIAYVRLHPEVDVIGCWPMDTDADKYCECPECLDTDTILKAVNEVARRVKTVRPEIIIEHLAYVSRTVRPPEKVLPERNVLVLLCEGKSKAWKAWADVCNRAGSAGVYYFVYAWADNYAQYGRTCLVPAHVRDRVKEAKISGLLGMAPLFLHTYNWWRSGFNIFLYSRFAWDVDADLNEILDDYYVNYYPGATNKMKRFFQLWFDKIIDPGPYAYGQLGPAENDTNKVAFAAAREALGKADAMVSTPTITNRIARSRLYLDFNEKWLTAQHERYLLCQAGEQQNKEKARIAFEVIGRLEKEMSEMGLKSREAGDGVLDHRFFILRASNRLQQDKYYLALAESTRVAAKTNAIYLGDLKPVEARQDYGVLWIDRSMENGQLAIGTNFYEKGLGTHANSVIIFDLGGKYKRFRCEVGVQGVRGGSVVFQVFLDGKKFFDSGVMRQKEGLKAVDLDVAVARELKLVVGDAGDGIGEDWANWADARLEIN